MSSNAANSTPAAPRCWGLLRRRQIWLPTWRGWLALLLLGVAFILLVGPHTYGFFAVNEPLPSGVLVVEGWLPDYGLSQAIEEFQRHPARKVFVTGGPIEHGAPLSEYKTYAELGAAVIVKLGLPSNLVQAIPSPPVCKDRTYASARALRKYLDEHQMNETQFNLFTIGTHGRRSRLLFEKGLGPTAHIGVVSVESRDFDPAHWWRYSASVRGVIAETLAYAYAKFLFRPAD